MHHDDDPKFRRAGAQAVAVILRHCAVTGRSYWAWAPWEWARLCGGSAQEFLDDQALPTERAVRPFLVELAYLISGFTGFQHLGMFNRFHLARLVYGIGTVDAAMSEATAVLDQWGYRSQICDSESGFTACWPRRCSSTGALALPT